MVCIFILQDILYIRFIMSWLNRRSSLREEDWNLLDFESSPNEALVVSIGNGQCHSEDNSESEADRGYAPQTNRTTIVGDSDLDQWLTQASNVPLSRGAI